MIEENEEIRVIGECPKYEFNRLIKEGLDRPYNKKSFFITYTYVNLKIDEKKCTRCMECLTSCPVGAIISEDNIVNYEPVCLGGAENFKTLRCCLKVTFLLKS